MKEKIVNLFKEHWLPLTLALGLSIGFILLFSHSTSPASWYYNGKNSSVAITISKGWYFDIIPYKDLFASDAPWMYLLGSIGFGIGNMNKGGIISVQICNLFLFLCALYYTTRLYTKNKWYTCMVLCICIPLLKQNYPDGMYAEEFMLPVIGWTYYCIAKYFKTFQLHWYDACIFGISIGITLMCLPQAIYTLLPIVFVYIHDFIHHHKQAFVFFLITLFISACIILPFLYYFYQNGCLQQFIYNVFIYQEDIYRKTIGTSYFYKHFFTLRFPTIALCIASFLFIIQKKYLAAISWGILGVVEVFIFLQINLEEVRSLYTVGNIAILCISIYPYLQSKKAILQISSIGMIALSFYSLYANDFNQAIRYTQIYSMYNNEGWEGLMENIPSEEYDSFVVYGNDTMQNTYLLTNAMPCYPYFYSQDALAEEDEAYKQDILTTFQEGNAKWILTDHSHEIIQEVLDTRYTLIESSNSYSIYKLNDIS